MALFSRAQKVSAALVDICEESVGGAYALYETGKVPALYYTARLPIEPHESEPLDKAAERTLAALLKEMVEKGAPILRRETGNGHPSRVIAVIGAPWQVAEVFREHIEEERPFTFTKTILESISAKARTYGSDRVDSGTVVLATVLNGYETAKPFGKRVTKARIVTLSSSVERDFGTTVRSMLQKTFHTRHVQLSGSTFPLYTVFRDLYPHQKDFLVLDVSANTTETLFAKHGILVAVSTTTHGVQDLLSIRHEDFAYSESAGDLGAMLHTDRTAAFGSRVEEAKQRWLAAMKEVFAGYAKEHALARTLFLVAQKGSHEFLARLLDSDELRSVWLSDEPLTVVPVLPEQFAPFVMTRGEAEPDVQLMIDVLGEARKVLAP